MARQDGRRPVKLLGEHDAGEPVRQRHGAERHLELRLCAETASPWPSAPPIRNAIVRRRLVAVRARAMRAKASLPKVFPRSSRATMRSDPSAAPNEALGLIRLTLLGARLPGFGEFGEHQRAERHAAPSLVDALGITLIKLALGPVFQRPIATMDKRISSLRRGAVRVKRPAHQVCARVERRATKARANMLRAQSQAVMRQTPVRRLLARSRGGPHLLEIVELANLGPEDVNHDVDSVDQHPVAGLKTFDADIVEAAFFQVLAKLFGDCAHVAVRPPGGNHHEVADRRLALEIDRDDLLGLASSSQATTFFRSGSEPACSRTISAGGAPFRAPSMAVRMVLEMSFPFDHQCHPCTRPSQVVSSSPVDPRYILTACRPPPAPRQRCAGEMKIAGSCAQPASPPCTECRTKD